MRNRWLFNRTWVSAGILSALLLGCGCDPKVPKPKPPIKIAVEGEASANTNRDANGDPLSVVIWIYHLKNKTEFSRLTFDMLNSGRSDQEMLGTDFLGRSELVAVPGTLYHETADLNPDTKYIGVVAFFRKPDPNYWRYLVSVEQLEQAKTRKKDWQGQKLPLFSFKIQDCYMALNYAKAEFIPGQPENAKPDCSGHYVYAPAFTPSTTPAQPAPSQPGPAKPSGSNSTQAKPSSQTPSKAPIITIKPNLSNPARPSVTITPPPTQNPYIQIAPIEQ
jgi:type VI secretion system protein VasD